MRTAAYQRLASWRLTFSAQYLVLSPARRIPHALPAWLLCAASLYELLLLLLLWIDIPFAFACCCLPSGSCLLPAAYGNPHDDCISLAAWKRGCSHIPNSVHEDGCRNFAFIWLACRIFLHRSFFGFQLAKLLLCSVFPIFLNGSPASVLPKCFSSCI